MTTYSDMKRVWERLYDDESKEIFDRRLSYAMGVSDGFDFFDLVKNEKCTLPASFYDWYDKQKQKDKLFVFGAGRIGEYTIEILKNNLINVEGCVDSYNSTIVNIKGVDVVSFDRLYEIREKCSVIIGSSNYRFQMLDQMLKNGFDISQIYIPTYGYMRGYVGRQYFDFFEPFSGGEVFVDGGAYDGMTTVDFFDWVGEKGGKSYMFEANVQNKKMIETTLRTHKIVNYTLITKGLYNKDCTLKFNTRGGAGARFSDDGYDIDVTSIDNTCVNDKITLIKMDIEGAESKAIEGAKKIIERDNPRLALSVYHKPNDFVNIPNELLDINPGYRFALRHYCTMAEETILYAWVE